MHNLTRKELATALSFFLASFILYLAIAVLREDPGYMDESYYLVGARNLAVGVGFHENILWNFLDDPSGFPHPSHLYWMPLISILSAGSMKVFGLNYIAGSIPHALIASIIAPCVYLTVMRWIKDQFWSVISGLLSIFGGYYLAYYSAVDAFSLYMLLGYGYFLAISKIFSRKQDEILKFALAAGILAGIMHLTRADGLLWAGMFPVFLAIAAFSNRKQKNFSLRSYMLSAFFGLLLYFIVMSPWYIRNIQLFGSLTAKGASSNLFLTTYNDLFSYPATIVNKERWLNIGLDALFQQRLQAGSTNLLSILGVQLLVVNLPFVVVGVWKNWHSIWIKVNVFGLLVLFAFFTILFPMAGMRGGFFHSGSAFQIFLWVMSIYGLKEVVSKLPLNENVNRLKFERFIGFGYFVVVLSVTGILIFSKLGTWNVGTEEISEIDQTLLELEIPPDEIILINDPATFHWVSNRPSIVIPNGDEDTMLSVMDRYDIEYAVLQVNHPPGLSGLYLAPYESEKFDVLVDENQWFIFQKVTEE